MNATAINQLRRKFIIISSLSFFVVILFTGGMAVLSSEYSLRTQAGHALELIVDNNGVLPEVDPSAKADELGLWGFSPEFLYAARYFTVTFDDSGHTVRTDRTHIASVNEEEAVEYAHEALRAYRESLTVSMLNLGVIDSLYYCVKELPGGDAMVAFLDCSFQVQVNREVARNTLLICSLGFLGSLILVILFSNRAVKPEIEYARKQKQFITNASHELKTPLAVIRANTEVIEMLQGESEWTQSTMGQVDRMDGLVQNLVMITRAEEREDRAGMEEIDVGEVVTRSVEPFRALAQQQHINLVYDPVGDVRMTADASAIQQLCTLLVDNAIKYCDPNGNVTVEVAQPRRGRVNLVVSNTFAAGQRAEFSRYFERFYRDDESHSDASGYGIGLSVAESICKRYSGSIKAAWRNGMAVFTCQLRSA